MLVRYYVFDKKPLIKEGYLKKQSFALCRIRQTNSINRTRDYIYCVAYTG